MSRLRVWVEKPTVARPRWSVVYERPAGGRGRRTVEGAAEAGRLSQLIRSALDQGRDPFARERSAAVVLEPSLADMSHAWLDDLERARKRSTVERHRHSLLLLFQYLEEKTGRGEAAIRGTDITTQAMRDYTDWLARPRTGRTNRSIGRSPSTVKKALETAYLFADWAERDERFAGSIRRPARVPIAPPGGARTGAPTWEQMARAIEAMPTPYMKRAATVMYYTGLRIDLQVMQLRWSDLDLKTGRIQIARPELCKSSYEQTIGRSIPMAPSFLDLAREWSKERAKPHPDQFVIVLEGSRPGPTKQKRELRGRDTKRAWIRALGQWPVDWKSPNHAFRRGFITGLRRLNVQNDVLSYLVGQKSPFLTETAYTDLEVVHGAAMKAAVGLIPPLGAGASTAVP